MLNRMTIKELPEADRTAVEVALMTLAQTGVLLNQIQFDGQQMITRVRKDEDLQKLTRDIVELRVESSVLQGLHDLGAQLVKEKSS